jgi:retron-type reverse transcriptase
MARILFNMKTYKNLYEKIYSLDNLILVWRKARKGKTKKKYVIEFEKNLKENLFQLQKELIMQVYFPKALKTFILRDPKTRKISKSAFRDRVVHHALVRVIDPIFDKIFIYDSCANRTDKGNLFTIKRFELFKRKVTNNFKSEAFCLKADIKHYFQEINHNFLIEIIKRKIKDERVIWLIEQILKNNIIFGRKKIGMPLGNLTSQFFANVYLNELDYFVKHKLKVKYYIRYVDDFVILHSSKEQLENWKNKIENFLRKKLELELHPDKSRIVALSKGIDFVGFRSFYYFKLLRKRNIKNMINKTELFKNKELNYKQIIESFQGWNAYAKWANSFKLRKNLLEGFMI